MTSQVAPLNVIPNNKYNKKIDPSKIFIPGDSMLDEIRRRQIQDSVLTYHRPTYGYQRRGNPLMNDVTVHLDSKFAKIDHVPGLKTTLYPHQQTAVKAMLDLEYGRTIHIKTTSSDSFLVCYNAGVLSEPVGSGKTIDILAVICMSRVPRAIPDIMELPYFKNDTSVGFIRRKFQKFLRPTIIFVGVSVMRQWEAAIQTFTDLKVYSVGSILNLRPMLQMIADGSINDYDIVLVKNGKITVSIELPDGIKLEKKNITTQPFIYNIVANMRNYCWARVVIDDFDTIKLPRNAGVVNGLFTWFISSTRKHMEMNHTNALTGYSASEQLKNFDYGCANIMYNQLMFTVFNVRNSIDHIKETTAIPNPKFHVAVFKNPNNQYIALLNGINDDQVNRITEMLNGDAIGAAAEAAGIKSTSVANIFERILGDRFKQYRFAGDLLSFIDHCREEESSRKSMDENDDEHDTYGKKDLLGFREIEYKYPGVNSLLNKTEEEYEEVKKTSGTAIQRVKDNIKHGRCPVCRDDLADCKDTAIAKCCGTVFCGNCGIEGQNLKDRYRKLSGRCSNCRADISIKDLIYMENFDLEKIENEEFEEEEESVDVTELKKEATKAAKPTTKYTAIVDIIMNREVAGSKRVDMYIPNMMKGGAYLSEPTIRKVLIFANFDETLKHVIAELDEEKIHYWRLMGSASDIDTVARAFTACKTTCALVVNSTKHCSGLNLQTATDLVFAHNIIDQAIESQVAGRGHRLGRKSPLNIWYMQYENEYAGLVQSHGVRDLMPEELKTEKDYEIGNASITMANVTDNTFETSDKKRPTVAKAIKHRKHRNEHNGEEDADSGDDSEDDDGEDDGEDDIVDNDE